jgi:hypothetical protein
MNDLTVPDLLLLCAALAGDDDGRIGALEQDGLLSRPDTGPIVVTAAEARLLRDLAVIR